MIIALGWALLFVKYPDMPIDPASLAGRVYYLCDSEVAAEFTCPSSSSSPSSRSPPRSEVGETEMMDFPERRYKFGEMVGVSGRKTVGIFAVVSSGHRQI